MTFNKIYSPKEIQTGQTYIVVQKGVQGVAQHRAVSAASEYYPSVTYSDVYGPITFDKTKATPATEFKVDHFYFAPVGDKVYVRKLSMFTDYYLKFHDGTTIAKTADLQLYGPITYDAPTVRQPAPYNNPHIKHYYGKTVLTRPTDAKDMTKLSIVVMRQSVLDKLSRACVPVAGGSEFQIHYRALVARLKTEHSELIFTFPTAYYNFDQKVSTGSVEYSMADVNKIAEITREASSAKATEIFASPIISALHAMGAEIYESNSGSIHRHPGDFSFSSVDLDKDPEEPGVIYRQKEAKDFVQTDSVIYIPTIGTTKVVTTETRSVNVSPAADGGISGTYTQIPTYSYIIQDSESVGDVFEELLGTLDESTDEFKIVTSLMKHRKYPTLMALQNMYSDIPVPDLTNVEPSRIVANYFSAGVGKGIKKTYKKAKHYLGFDDQWDDYEDDFNIGYGV